jgi:hypothetical protein
MTNTPVPHPYQCAHIIQVTQRARYLEVTANINIVTSHNIFPTTLHSYTLRIWLSFLSLPWYIQRLVGEIQALPTPLPFDFNEPVELMIATDEYVLFGVGYHRWALVTKDKTILFCGGGPDDGIQSLMTSYRLELGGVMAGLAVMGTLFGAGTIYILSVQFFCDNEYTVIVDRRPIFDSVFHNTTCDGDLIMTIQDLIMRWCTLMMIFIEQDLIPKKYRGAYNHV